MKNHDSLSPLASLSDATPPRAPMTMKDLVALQVSESPAPATRFSFSGAQTGRVPASIRDCMLPPDTVCQGHEETEEEITRQHIAEETHEEVVAEEDAEHADEEPVDEDWDREVAAEIDRRMEMGD